MPPILFVVKDQTARVLPNYLFNNNNEIESNNTSTIIWKTTYTKIA